MKRKTIIISATLGVILISGIASGTIVIKKLDEAKQNSISVKNQLASNKILSSDEQVSIEALGKPIEEPKNEDVKVELGPSDPNKMLSSGLTLWDAKILLDGVYVGNLKEKTARNVGTTMEEIERLPSDYVKGKDPVIVAQAPTKPSTGGTAVSQPSSGGTVTKPSAPKTSTGGTTQVNNLDKNGNGIEDELEPFTGGSNGTTHSVPASEIGLFSNGDEPKYIPEAERTPAPQPTQAPEGTYGHYYYDKYGNKLTKEEFDKLGKATPTSTPIPSPTETQINNEVQTTRPTPQP